jgi:DNA-binding transcriptional ArsR family regulator
MTPKAATCALSEHALRKGRGRPTPTTATLAGAAEIFQAAGDERRLRLLVILCEGPKSVVEIAAEAGHDPSLVSQQLRVLRRARLVRGEPEGRLVIYRLYDIHTQQLIENAVAHARHSVRTRS